MNYKRYILALAAGCLLGIATAGAEAPTQAADYSTELHTPEIPKKQVANVRTYMERQLKSMHVSDKTHAEIVDEYIIKYTIPTSLLFEPNGFNLENQATEFLSPVLPFLRHHGKYKVVMTMHTDGTGSESYQKILCDNRILSLYDFFDTKIGSQSLVFGYSLSDSEPLAPNNSFKYRARNRRVDIYIVPGPTFMQDFKLKK